MKTPRVTLTRHADFTDMLGDLRLIAAAIGPARSACLLAVDADDAASPFARDEQPGWASFPRSRAERPYKAVAFQHDGTRFTRTELPEVAFAFPFIQILRTGHILLAGSRCRYVNGRAELNAALYSPEGTLEHRMTLGDGIQDIQSARDGALWLGGGSLTHPRHITLVLPDGEPLSTGTIVGRGSILHAIVGTCWYQLDLNELP